MAINHKHLFNKKIKNMKNNTLQFAQTDTQTLIIIV